MGRKGYGRDWTLETIRRPLEQLYRGGYSESDMARLLNIDPSNVRRWRRRLGLPPIKRQVTADERGRMVAMREGDQMTLGEIARATGRAKGTVEAHLKIAAREMGRAIRTPHEAIYQKRLDGLRRLHELGADWQPYAARMRDRHQEVHNGNDRD